MIVPVFKTGGRHLSVSSVGSTPTRFRHVSSAKNSYIAVPCADELIFTSTSDRAIHSDKLAQAFKAISHERLR